MEFAPNWIIDLQFSEVEIADDGLFSFFEGETEVHIYYDEFFKAKGTDLEKAEASLLCLREIESAVSITERLSSETYIGGKAIISLQTDDITLELYWVLHGVMIRGDERVLITICYPSEEYRDWAVSTWMSIMRLAQN